MTTPTTAGAGAVGEHDIEEFRCPSCGNTTFQVHGRTSYTQRVVLKANQAGAVSLDEDDDCGGWGDRTSYPDGDVLAGVECCRCLAEIETLDEHLQPDDLKPAVREHAKLNSFLQQHHRAGEQGAAAVTIPITAGLHDYLVERRDTLRTVIDARHASA